jgi:uncharacterized protein
MTMRVTSSILEMLDQLPASVNREAAIEKIKGVIKFYQDQINKSNGTPQQIATNLYDLMDGLTKDESSGANPTSCKKGCSFCCNYYTACSDREALLIIDYCKEYNIAIDINYLREQAKLGWKEFTSQEHTACVFLSNQGTCNIYEVRPLSCRKYYVISPPELCDQVTHPGAKVARIGNVQAECLVSAAGSDETNNSIPRALLKML